METWGWLLAYVVGFGLLQVFLFRYFRREDPAPDATPGRVDRGAAASPPVRSPDEPDGVHCRHCGTHNAYEPNYAYCRNCVRPLR